MGEVDCQKRNCFLYTCNTPDLVTLVGFNTGIEAQ